VAGEGQELAVAIVRFSGDDKQYQATKARVLDTSKALTGAVAAEASKATAAVTASASATAEALGTAGKAAGTAVGAAVPATKALGSAYDVAAARAKALTGSEDALARTMREHNAFVGTQAAKLQVLGSSFGKANIEAGRAKQQFEAFMGPVRQAGPALASAGQAAAISADGLRKVAGAALPLVGGLGPAGGAIRGVAASLSGMSLATLGTGLAMGGAAIALGLFIAKAEEANQATRDIAFATLTNDTTMATAALTAGTRALSDFATNAKLGKGEVEGATIAQMALAAASNLIDTVMGTTATKVKLAIEANTGYLGSLLRIKDALAAERAELTARNAAIGGDIKRAQSLEEVARLYDEQITNIKRLAAADAEEAAVAAKGSASRIAGLIKEAEVAVAAAKAKVAAEQLKWVGGDPAKAQAAEAAAERQLADLKETLRSKEVAGVRTAGAAKVATTTAVRAVEEAAAAAKTAATLADIAQTEKLADLNAARATGAAQAAAASVEAAHQAAAADAAFFGESERGFAAYQEQRRAGILATTAAELAGIEAVAAAQRAALQTKLAAPESTLPERTAAAAALVALDTQTENTRIALSQRTAAALRADDAAIVADRRARAAESVALDVATYAHKAAMGEADYAGQLSRLQRAAQDENLSQAQRRQYAEQAFAMYGQLQAKAAGYYDSLASMGAVSAQKHIGFLDAQASNEKLSADQRIGFAKQAFEAKLALEQALFDRTAAMQGASEAASVAFMAAQTQNYEAGSKKRIEAETKWATAVRALQASVAASAKAALDIGIAGLAAKGQKMMSLAGMEQSFEQQRLAAAKTLATLQRGGSASEADIANMHKMGAAIADMTAKGQTFKSMSATMMDKLGNDLAGIPNTAGAAASSLGQVGVAGAGIGSKVGAATNDIVSELNKINTATDKVETNFGQLGAGAGAALSDGLGQGLSGALGVLDTFLSDADAKITAGTSKMADSIYAKFTSRLMSSLDAERQRS